MIGWYFATTERTLRYGDDRKIELGKTHTVKGQPILCERGLHASKNILDALQYAPGPVIYKVQLSHKVVHGDDKSCAQRRKYLAGAIDISDTLRLFARQCALDVIHLWNAPNIVIQYLNTGDESIRDAARAAARDAAWDDDWAAARAAARPAARNAQNKHLTDMVEELLKEVR